MSQGDSNNVLVERGDLMVKGGSGNTRIPIDPKGHYLFSDGVDAKWGTAKIEQFYMLVTMVMTQTKEQKHNL